MRVEASAEVAESRGIPVTLVRSEGAGAVERLASLVGPLDFATVYAALAQPVDPSPVRPIDEVKARLG